MVRAITRRANGLMEGRRVIKGLEESSLKGLESSLSERRTQAGSSQTGCPQPGPEQAPDEVGKAELRPLYYICPWTSPREHISQGNCLFSSMNITPIYRSSPSSCNGELTLVFPKSLYRNS